MVSLIRSARDSAYNTQNHKVFYESDDGRIGIDITHDRLNDNRAIWANLFIYGMRGKDNNTVWKTLYPENIDDLITMLEFALKTHFPEYERKSS